MKRPGNSKLSKIVFIAFAFYDLYLPIQGTFAIFQIKRQDLVQDYNKFWKRINGRSKFWRGYLERHKIWSNWWSFRGFVGRISNTIISTGWIGFTEDQQHCWTWPIKAIKAELQPKAMLVR